MILCEKIRALCGCYTQLLKSTGKISLDHIAAINPLIASLPFASNNDNVISEPKNLLNPDKVRIEPNITGVPWIAQGYLAVQRKSG